MMREFEHCVVNILNTHSKRNNNEFSREIKTKKNFMWDIILTYIFQKEQIQQKKEEKKKPKKIERKKDRRNK